MCVCGIDVDAVSQYMVYMVYAYNCVYYCETCYIQHTNIQTYLAAVAGLVPVLVVQCALGDGEVGRALLRGLYVCMCIE
jgi:hypothetical protein